MSNAHHLAQGNNKSCERSSCEIEHAADYHLRFFIIYRITDQMPLIRDVKIGPRQNRNMGRYF